MKPECVPASWARKAGKPLTKGLTRRSRRAFAHDRKLCERDGETVHGLSEMRRHRMRFGLNMRCVGRSRHEGIVGDRGKFLIDCAGGGREDIPRRAMNMGDRAEAERILGAATFSGSDQLAAGETGLDLAGNLQTAGGGAHGKRRIRTARRSARLRLLETALRSHRPSQETRHA